jgi:dihydroorotate dehydrogenase electron transfer subunit
LRLSTAIITANSRIRSGVHLIEMHAPKLAQAAQPGQYCMVRCCDTLATDPLLRRPFFVHTVQRGQGLCTLLVHVRGRGTAWLVKQQEGASLDILGPMGHGWIVRPVVRNLLLISEGARMPALTLLAQAAIEQELAVTIMQQCENADGVYPPALLPAEAEYQIVTRDGSVGLRGELLDIVGNYLGWADAAYCSVSQETSLALYHAHDRLRLKHFAQATMLQSLACGSGACLSCTVKTHSGPKLVCRDGPVFDLRDIV